MHMNILHLCMYSLAHSMSPDIIVVEYHLRSIVARFGI